MCFRVPRARTETCHVSVFAGPWCASPVSHVPQVSQVPIVDASNVLLPLPLSPPLPLLPLLLPLLPLLPLVLPSLVFMTLACSRQFSPGAPAPPPGAWWWERLAHGVQTCGPLIEACGDPCHTVVDDDTYPAPAGWNPPSRVRRGASPPRAPRPGGKGPA